MATSVIKLTFFLQDFFINSTEIKILGVSSGIFFKKT